MTASTFCIGGDPLGRAQLASVIPQGLAPEALSAGPMAQRCTEPGQSGPDSVRVAVSRASVEQVRDLDDALVVPTRGPATARVELGGVVRRRQPVVAELRAGQQVRRELVGVGAGERVRRRVVAREDPVALGVLEELAAERERVLLVERELRTQREAIPGRVDRLTGVR